MTALQKRNQKFIQEMAGYDPAQYRAMLVLFVVLSIINVAFVLLAFTRTGFGLYRAEDALSHVSQITQCVQRINECSQNIVIHCDDRQRLASEHAKIDSLFGEMDRQSELYRAIDLDLIDKGLRTRFDNACTDTDSYRRELLAFLEELRETEQIDPAETAFIYSIRIEPLKVKADQAMNMVFDAQDSSTYLFFVRAARQFLFVLLFLLVTMTVGVIGIRRMQRNARSAADAMAMEHERAQWLRQKSKNMIYNHFLTGFKNYYGLEKELSEIMSTREVSVALCRFNKFSQINEIYGRGRADEFLTTVAGVLKEQYGKIADIYSTANDEFCLVFRSGITQMQLEETVQSVAETLSAAFDVNGFKIQKTVSCCYYAYAPRMKETFSELFRSLDRAMSVAKEQNLVNGKNAVINVNTLLGVT